MALGTGIIQNAGLGFRVEHWAERAQGFRLGGTKLRGVLPGRLMQEEHGL